MYSDNLFKYTEKLIRLRHWNTLRIKIYSNLAFIKVISQLVVKFIEDFYSPSKTNKYKLI
jgi:hypothetical protein